MARRERSEDNILNLHDNLSDTEIQFRYRSPTTREQNGYSNMAIQRKRNKVINKTIEARVHYGLEILTGIREGDFERKVGTEWVPISSDPASSNYLEDWKGWLKIHASDLVQLLAAFVFDNSAVVNNSPDEEEEPETEDLEQD